MGEHRWQDLNMIVAACGLTDIKAGDRVRLVTTTDEWHEGWIGEAGTVATALPGHAPPFPDGPGIVRVYYEGGARLTMEDGTDVLERA